MDTTQSATSNIDGDIVNTALNLSALVKHFDRSKRTWPPDLFKEGASSCEKCGLLQRFSASGEELKNENYNKRSHAMDTGFVNTGSLERAEEFEVGHV